MLGDSRAGVQQADSRVLEPMVAESVHRPLVADGVEADRDRRLDTGNPEEDAHLVHLKNSIIICIIKQNVYFFSYSLMKC